MQTIPLEAGLIFSAALFCIGMVGLLCRRNLIFSLIAIDVMLSAAGVAFVVGAKKWGAVDGQIMFLFILAIAASEMAIGLSILFQQDKLFGTMDPDSLQLLRGLKNK